MKKVFLFSLSVLAFVAVCFFSACQKDMQGIEPQAQEEQAEFLLTDTTSNGFDERQTEKLGVRSTCAGTTSATFNGVPARLNCPVGSASVYGYNYETGVNTGYKWQCVEYVNRYYYVVYKMNLLNTSMYGNAKNYYLYGSHAAIGMAKYANGGSVAPQVGDIIISTAGTYGHVAIVTSVSSTKIGIIDQNFSSSSVRTLSRSGNTVSGFSSAFPVAGWIRKASGTPAQMPTLSTPAANATNLSGNINFTWSSPNATEYRIQIIDAALYKGFNASKGFVTAAGVEAPDCAYNQNIGSQSSFVWTNAQKGKTYYWTVRANNSGGASTFASYRTFTTASQAYCNLSSTAPISTTNVANSSTITVSANTTWLVSSNATSWCTVSPASGNGNGSFRISWLANSSSSTRTATVTLTSSAGNRTITVTQIGVTVTLSVTPTSHNISSAAISNGLATRVTTNASSWTVQSNTSWISVLKLNTGFVISCQANTSTVGRMGTITVRAGDKTQTITITQARR